MSETRIERDSLGEIALPASALYGIQTARAVVNLSFSGKTLARYPGLLRGLVFVKKAAAEANGSAGVIDSSIGQAIGAACDTLLNGEHVDQFPVDVLGGGGWIGLNANVNEVLANLANESCGGARGSYQPVHPKRHVNASQSTADVCHTAIRLAVVEDAADLLHALEACSAACAAKGVELRDVQTLARTCLQDALPVSLGATFGAHAAVLGRRTTELARSVSTLEHINLGGTVIGSGAGAALAYRDAVLAKLNALTGRQLALRADLYDAAQHIDDLVAVSSQLALLAEAFIKIAQDLRLLASGPAGGFGEIRLPATQEGSSFFAGKINPVVPETLLQCCFQVIGCDRAAHIALERGEPNLNVFEGVAGINVLDAMHMLTRAVRLFTERCVKGIVANAERCGELAALVEMRK